MALELAPHVRVNSVCAGWVDTDRVRREYIDQAENPAEYETATLQGTPLKRLAKPSEIAGAVCYLSGRKAAILPEPAC